LASRTTHGRLLYALEDELEHDSESGFLVNISQNFCSLQPVVALSHSVSHELERRFSGGKITRLFASQKASRWAVSARFFPLVFRYFPHELKSESSGGGEKSFSAPELATKTDDSKLFTRAKSESARRVLHSFAPHQ
jgi:hypothetical protein